MGGNFSRNKKIDFNSSKVKIATTISLIGIVFGIYYNRSKLFPPQGPRSRRDSSGSSEQVRGAINSIALVSNKSKPNIADISVELSANTQLLSINTVIQILEKLTEFEGTQYVQLTLSYRKQRRAALKKSEQTYFALIVEYLEKVDELIEKQTQEICQQIGIAQDQFQSSILSFMERGLFEQYIMVEAGVRQRLKEKVQSTRAVDSNQLTQVLEFQLALLNSKHPRIQKLISRAKSNQDPDLQQMTPQQLNLVLYDLIYENFGVEEEDILKVTQSPQNQGNARVLQLGQAIAQQIMALLS